MIRVCPTCYGRKMVRKIPNAAVIHAGVQLEGLEPEDSFVACSTCKSSGYVEFYGGVWRAGHRRKVEL